MDVWITSLDIGFDARTTGENRHRVDAGSTLIGRTKNFGNVLKTMEALLGMFKEVGFIMNLKMVEVEEWLTHYSQPFP